MACAAPITTKTPKGNILTACKQCLPCRIRKQSSLTLRCLLENRSSWSGRFVTLTYEDAPEVGAYKDFQSFLDRLRAQNRRAGNTSKIRYLGTGEYGTKYGRFHYHALIWNDACLDQERFHTRLWPQGFLHTGEVTPASIRYTARYNLKFPAPGEPKPVHGWSRQPPIGEATMTCLGREARRKGHVWEEPPSILSIDGTTYPVDSAMRVAWMMGYDPEKVIVTASGTRKLANCGVAAHLEYRKVMIEGDPFLNLRTSKNSRSEWWERVRSSNGKL